MLIILQSGNVNKVKYEKIHSNGVQSFLVVHVTVVTLNNTAVVMVTMFLFC